MIKLRDLGADTSTMMPYIEEYILSMVIKGKQRGHIPGKGRDHMLVAANIHVKAQRRELKELRSVVKSDSRMAELLSQLGSQSKICLGSEGGDNDEGEDDDADVDEEEGIIIWVHMGYFVS
ncbi:hypothetical protein Tco_1062255 [Tanacetum coccineum]